MTISRIRRTQLAWLSAFASVTLLTGCLLGGTASDPQGEVRVTQGSQDKYIAFLTELGVPEENIRVSTDAETGDTVYTLVPTFSPEAIQAGALGSGQYFTRTLLEQIIEKSKGKAKKGLETAAAASGNGNLAKAAHTRWTHFYSLFDVKKLTEVRQVKVFIKNNGSDGLGPNWRSAAQAAISNWNNQAKGTAISFVETSDINQSDVIVRGLYTWEGVGILTYMNPTQYVGRLGSYGGNPEHQVDIILNTRYESNGGTPHNQKTTVVMAGFGRILNFANVGAEGEYWNYGVATYIPGTPASDGNAWTSGSSILTSSTSPVSTPVMTAGDLKAFRTLYPTHGAAALLWNGALVTVGYEGPTMVASNIVSFQQQGDTIIYLASNGWLYRRVGVNGTNFLIWPGIGSSGTVSTFTHSNGHLAVQTTTGALYSRNAGASNWIFRTSGNIQYRLADERLVVNFADYNDLYSIWLVSNPNWVYEWGGGYIHDFQAHPANQRLAIAVDGHLYAKDGYNSWVGLHGSGDGYVTNVFLSSTHVVAYLNRGNWYDEVRVKQGLHGTWEGYMGAIYGPQNVDLCGDKLALLNWGNDLYVKDYATGQLHYHGELDNGYYTQAVRLSGGNCDYVTRVDHWGGLKAKYGVDLNTDYVDYWSSVGSLWNRRGLD
jgi:hypothetical protein